MDLPILFIVFTAIFCFFIAHIFVFRSIKQSEVMAWFMILYGSFGLLIPGAAVLFLFLTIKISVLSGVFIFLMSFVLYTLCVFIFLIGVFGILESSIRIRVLSEIKEAGNKGITKKELFRRYNMRKIVDRRITRFVDSGEIIQANNYVSRKKTFSVYLMAAMVLNFVWNLYGEPLIDR